MCSRDRDTLSEHFPEVEPLNSYFRYFTDKRLGPNKDWQSTSQEGTYMYMHVVYKGDSTNNNYSFGGSLIMIIVGQVVSHCISYLCV